MTFRSTILIWTIALSLANAVLSCGPTTNKKDEREIKSNDMNRIQFDTSKTTIITFDQNGNYPFENSYKPTTLAQADINCIDSLLIICVTDYNNSLDEKQKIFDKDHKRRSIDLKMNNYRTQLIAVTNKKGEKEVWVNSFCEIWDSYKWRTQIISVIDGGSCYFNFKINLTTKKYYNLEVNSTG
jgi:hypothetical protein